MGIEERKGGWNNLRSLMEGNEPREAQKLWRDLRDDLHREDRQREEEEMKILIVDDEESVRHVMVDLLGAVKDMNPRLPKLHIHVADNGAIGGKKALEQNVDLILTDWMMPRMNGTRMTRAVRLSGFTGKIVMLTSAAGEQEAGARKAGVDEVYSKPITLDLLEEIILQARQDMLAKQD